MSRRSIPSHNPTPETADAILAIARRIREEQSARGLTNTQMGKLVGVTRFTVAAALRGRASTSVGIYVALARALGLRIEVREPLTSETSCGSSPSWPSRSHEETVER